MSNKINSAPDTLPPPLSRTVTHRVLAMKVGEVEFFESKPTVVRTIVSSARRKHPRRKFQTRTEEGGVRVWRTA